MIQINKLWHATPVFDDGSAGSSERFTEASAAWEWARVIYPTAPVSVKAGPKKRSQATQRYSRLA